MSNLPGLDKFVAERNAERKRNAKPFDLGSFLEGKRYYADVADQKEKEFKKRIAFSREK